MPAETDTVDPGAKLLDDFFPDDPKSNPVVETPAAEPVAEVKSEPVKSKFPRYLLDAAKRVGMDQTDIDECSDKTELTRAIEVINSTRKEVQQANIPSGRDPKTGQFTKQEPVPESPPEFSLKDVGVDLADFDEDTQARLTKALTPFAKRQKDIDDKLAAMEQRDVFRQQNAHLDRLDQRFVENEELFGKGKRGKLDPDSDEFARRCAVVAEMDRIRQSGKTEDFEEAFDLAAKRLGFTAQPKPEPVVEKVATPAEPAKIHDPHGFGNGKLGRPTVRETKPEAPGTRLAVANLTATLKERAKSVDTSEWDELPDA